MKSLLVSVNYSDYLNCILKYNTKTFEEIVVVTVESDKNCQQLCDQYGNVTCVIVDDVLLLKNNATFNKGALLNVGMDYLVKQKYTGYICLTDSDVIFHGIEKFDSYTHELESMGHDCKMLLHGMSRYIIEHAHNFREWIQDPKLDHDYVKRLSLGKERTLLGYAQIFHFDHQDEWRDHNNNPIWSQDEHCVNAQQVDAKFIGNFLNRTKKQPNWRDVVSLDTNEFIYSRIVYDNNTPGLEYGVHIESADMYCVHVGHTWVNRDGRVSSEWNL